MRRRKRSGRSGQLDCTDHHCVLAFCWRPSEPFGVTARAPCDVALPYRAPRRATTDAGRRPSPESEDAVGGVGATWGTARGLRGAVGGVGPTWGTARGLRGAVGGAGAARGAVGEHGGLLLHLAHAVLLLAQRVAVRQTVAARARHLSRSKSRWGGGGIISQRV